MSTTDEMRPSWPQRPLSSEMIEQRLQEAGDSRKLDLSGSNLQGIDLSRTDLSGANLSRTNLMEAYLHNADLSGANLSHANLSRATLNRATLRGANLMGAALHHADLSNVNLSAANLSEASLKGANCREANLSGADLRGADLSGANFNRASLKDIRIRADSTETLLTSLGVQWVSAPSPSDGQEVQYVLSLRLREEPLTAQTLLASLAALIDLHTCCWLLLQRRDADAMTYARTKERHLKADGSLIVENLAKPSPRACHIHLQAQAHSQALTEALTMAIEAMTHPLHRWQAATVEKHLQELESQHHMLQTQEAQTDLSEPIETQHADLERQHALLLLEQQRLGKEREKLELQKAWLELETQRLTHAQETARTLLDVLRPEANVQTKAMLAYTLLPSLLQLAERKEVELMTLEGGEGATGA